MSWGLRTRSPPSPPAIALPSGVTINDETLESLDLRHGSILLRLDDIVSPAVGVAPQQTLKRNLVKLHLKEPSLPCARGSFRVDLFSCVFRI